MEDRHYKVLGFMIIHYGKEYLKESLLSIINHVDKIVIAYSKLPSQGHVNKTAICPDTELELRTIAESVCGDKLIWDSAESYCSESLHRDVRFKYRTDEDLILTIDADEIFEGDDIEQALQYAFNNKEKYYGINGYYNFWRSFNWCCTDGFRPIRLEKINAKNTLQNLECKLRIYHFSTAQSIETMRYKYLIFGHASEIRHDYLQEKVLAWTPEKNDEITMLHPASSTIWVKAEPFDKETLPLYLKDHKNFDKQLII